MRKTSQRGTVPSESSTSNQQDLQTSAIKRAYELCGGSAGNGFAMPPVVFPSEKSSYN